MNTPEPYLVWKEPAGERSAPVQAMDRAGALRWIRYGALATLIFIVIPPFPFLLAPLWLASMATGYGAAALIAILMLLPLRRLAGWPGTRLSVERHKRLGEWALALAAIHTGLLLVGDSVTFEYIWPSQPRFMLAGNVGIVLLALLVATSLERVRVVLFGNHERYRPVHLAGSVVLIVLTAAHIAGSGMFVASPSKAALLALISVGLVATILKKPASKSAPPKSLCAEEHEA